MNLEDSALDGPFFRQLDGLMGTETLDYAPRFETLLPHIAEGGSRTLDSSKSTRIIASNEPRRVSRREPESTEAGIHFRIQYPSSRRGSRSDMRYSPSRRSFLRTVLRSQSVPDRSEFSGLSDADHLSRAPEEITPSGVVLTGRGPVHPHFFQLQASGRTDGHEHRVAEHGRFGVLSYLFIDGRDTACSTLNLYRSGDSLLVAVNSGGFFPRMWHADEIEAALGMELPGTRPDDSSDLSQPRIIRDSGRVSLLNYTNGRPDRNRATRLFVGDAEVRLSEIGDQEYALTANDRTFSMLSVRYWLTDYEPERREDRPYKTTEELTPQDIRAAGFACCLAEPKLTRFQNHSDQEWASSLTDYFSQTTPGMQVNKDGDSVRLVFEPFGIDSTMRRVTSDGNSAYSVNGQERTMVRGSPSVTALVFGE